MARDVRLQATWAEHEQHRIPGPCPWYCGYQARVWGWLPTSSDPPTQQVTDVPANVFFQSWRNFQCEFAKEITGNFVPATMIISSVRRAVRVRLKFLIARLLLVATKEFDDFVQLLEAKKDGNYRAHKNEGVFSHLVAEYNLQRHLQPGCRFFMFCHAYW